MWRRFANRQEAGRLLALQLLSYRPVPGLLVLGLPRGGVPVAFEVARELNAEFDVFTVRKLGVPAQPELAMGAIATGGVRVLNPEVIEPLLISDEVIDAVTRREQAELQRREKLYRQTHLPLDLAGRTLILVDDGIATGSTMLAAIEAAKSARPLKVVVAAPVAAMDTLHKLRSSADDVVVLDTPEPFFGVGQWYTDFSEVSDKEVRNLLHRSQKSQPLHA